MRRGVSVLARSLLLALVLLIFPAVAANATTVVGSGPVVGGESLTVACP